MLIEKEQQKEEHLLVRRYLEDHSLVESNIVSFNNFLNHRMQEIIDELNESMPKEDIEIRLGKIRIGRPAIYESED
jgi:DNA-directed RNA polymerase beta subunit